MGDMTARVEGLMLRGHGDGLRADILKIGHHGAVDATNTAFMEAVHPK